MKITLFTGVALIATGAFGLAGNGRVALPAIGRACARVEQPQIVRDLRNRSDRAARAAADSLLFNGHSG